MLFGKVKGALNVTWVAIFSPLWCLCAFILFSVTLPSILKGAEEVLANNRVQIGASTAGSSTGAGLSSSSSSSSARERSNRRRGRRGRGSSGRRQRAQDGELGGGAAAAVVDSVQEVEESDSSAMLSHRGAAAGQDDASIEARRGSIEVVVVEVENSSSEIPENNAGRNRNPIGVRRREKSNPQPAAFNLGLLLLSQGMMEALGWCAMIAFFCLFPLYLEQIILAITVTPLKISLACSFLSWGAAGLFGFLRQRCISKANNEHFLETTLKSPFYLYWTVVCLVIFSNLLLFGTNRVGEGTDGDVEGEGDTSFSWLKMHDVTWVAIFPALILAPLVLVFKESIISCVSRRIRQSRFEELVDEDDLGMRSGRRRAGVEGGTELREIIVAQRHEGDDEDNDDRGIRGGDNTERELIAGGASPAASLASGSQEHGRGNRPLYNSSSRRNQNSNSESDFSDASDDGGDDDDDDNRSDQSFDSDTSDHDERNADGENIFHRHRRHHRRNRRRRHLREFDNLSQRSKLFLVVVVGLSLWCEISLRDAILV